MIDAPGPWGTGPFTLVEGASSISTRCAIQRAEPFACTWLIESEDRTDEVVLEATASTGTPTACRGSSGSSSATA